MRTVYSPVRTTHPFSRNLHRQSRFRFGCVLGSDSPNRVESLWWWRNRCRALVPPPSRTGSHGGNYFTGCTVRDDADRCVMGIGPRLRVSGVRAAAERGRLR